MVLKVEHNLEIPLGWEMKSLKDLSSLITKGTSPSSIGYSFVDEGINFIKVESVSKNNNIIPEQLAKIPRDCHKRLSRSIILEKDLLISIAGTLGRLGIVEKEYLPANTNQALSIIRLKDKSNVKYIYYALQLNRIKKEINNIATTGAQPNLSLKQVGDFQVLLPPLNERNIIVDILSKSDEQIKKTEQLIEKTKELKKGLMQQLLTKGINHTEFKDTHLGKIPVEWNIVSFKSVCNIVQGLVSPNDEPYLNYPHIGNANIEKETGKLHSYKLAKEENLISGKYLFGENHVLYGKINPHFAKVAYPKFIGICSADMYPIECKKDILPMFLKFSLLSSRFTKEMTASSARTGIPKVNRKEVENYNFLLPPIKEQQKIADILSSVTEQIEVYQKEKDKQSELRKALMQQLLTGRIRVTV